MLNGSARREFFAKNQGVQFTAPTDLYQQAAQSKLRVRSGFDVIVLVSYLSASLPVSDRGKRYL
jgi:hypothetical protein